MTFDWLIPSDIPDLKAGELHLWKVYLSGNIPVDEETLSEDERVRRRRFRFGEDRQRFGLARILLRRLLGGYLNRIPEQIKFDYTEYGKPTLSFVVGQERMEFNVSHSGDVILLAFTRGVPVGVDVEQIKTLPDLELIAKRFFSSAEQQDLDLLSGLDKVAAFFRCWTRKESVIKACGEGLSMPLDSFQVSLLPGEPAHLLRSPDQNFWMLLDLAPEPGYAAAVAAPVKSLRVRYFSAEKF
jgi:4'-phosphopantetheinyl transferase